LEAARDLLTLYGVSVGAGGADCLELSSLYRGHGLEREEFLTLALEVERGGDVVIGGALQRLLKLGGAAYGCRFLPPLLFGGLGMKGVLAALSFACSPIQSTVVQYWEKFMSRLEELEGSTFLPTTATGTHLFWYIYGGEDTSDREGGQFLCDHSHGAPWTRIDGGASLEQEAVSLPLSKPAWLRGIRRVFLEHALLMHSRCKESDRSEWGATHFAASFLTPLVVGYWETLGDIVSLTGLLPSRRAKQDTGLLGEFRKRALYMLTLPEARVDADLALRSFETLGLADMGFNEEHTLLLSCLGRHEEALCIARDSIKDPLYFKEYCTRTGAFDTLARVAFSGEGVCISDVSQLLVGHLGSGGMSALRTLSLISDDTPLLQVKSLALAGIERVKEWVKADSAAVSVANVARDRSLKELYRKRARFVVVDMDSLCGICNRKLAVKTGDGWTLGIFAVILKGGKKAHAGCISQESS